MKKSAGGPIILQNLPKIDEYTVGDMSSIVGAFSGSLLDWAYGASWDNKDPAATQARCLPATEPKLEADFFTRSPQMNVRTAIFGVLTDPN
jgi:hypothetical protein